MSNKIPNPKSELLFGHWNLEFNWALVIEIWGFGF